MAFNLQNAINGGSQRRRTITPPPVRNPITGREYGAPPPPELDEVAAARFAAGQEALAGAQTSAQRRAAAAQACGYDVDVQSQQPRTGSFQPSTWRGLT